YEAWEDCSTTASSDTSRQNVINAGQNFAQSLQIAANHVKEQITSLYDDISLSVDDMNRLLGQMVELNKNIAGIEATGAHANDLRDQRDLIVDQLTEMTNITVYEASNGMYTLVSNGTTLVNGITKVDLEMSPPKNNNEYSLTDFDIMIKQTGTIYTPGGGELKAQFEAIAEDKAYIDEVARMATFLLTTFNHQHRAGYGIDGNKDHPFNNVNPDDDATTGLNFYGESDVYFDWSEENGLVMCEVLHDGTLANSTARQLKGMQILDMLVVNSELTAVDGHKKLATRSGERNVNGELVYQAATGGGTTTDPHQARESASGLPVPVDVNGSGDGSNAVWIAALLNCEYDKTSPEVINDNRAIGKGSLFSYYNTNMTTMGSSAANMNGKVEFQSNVMLQVENLRSSTNGVNWDEELTNMIMFQQGYSACSRCLNAMDECLDKLINGTGTVGR
ncbi:MAG: flagellar basal body rod C-terminal domain-containing protein, partial [Anaerovibrio sp.]|uniref:flagellar hook-associated protein FlgK n=1 Tax=Anaerovibrio sp. TaxID=1872532 RepID=UPI002E771493